MSNIYSQTFKNTIPTENIFELLDKICAKEEKYFVVDSNAYKKGVFTGVIQEFFDFCKPYYYISKRKYLERELTNKSFLTVIRQICKYNKIRYNTLIMYNKSSYDIVYNVYYC
jgi:hypothetical protein